MSERTVRLEVVSPARGAWCPGCGRKRTADGRCARCDAWWGSPLVSVGLPLILSAVVLLAVGIWALRGWDQASGSRRVVQAAPLVFSPVFSGTPSPALRVRTAAAGLSPLVFPEEPKVERRVIARPISRQEQVRLRLLSDHVHAVIVAADAAREAERDNSAPLSSSLRTRSVSFTPSTQSAAEGALPLPSQIRGSGAASGFFDQFAPGSAPSPALPAGNYAPGASLPTPH